MKTKTKTVLLLSLSLVICASCSQKDNNAPSNNNSSNTLNYTISFTGTGASTTVNSVIVQNLTKGTSVTVPDGNVLNLSDAPNAVEQVSANNETIRVYSASVEGKSIISFFAKQAGVTQLNAYSLDGRKVTGISTDLQVGSNMFELARRTGYE